MVTGGLAIAGLAFLTVSNGGGPSSAGAAAAQPEVVAKPAVPPVAPGRGRVTEAAPRWTDGNRSRWLGPGKRGVALEVAAANTVGVWMGSVRPSLVVRCTGGRTEVFVFTQSHIQLEAGTEDHTITFAIDDGDEVSERWPDSAGHDALFAPDGAALAKRLLQSRSMRFGYTPHNAAPAVARFQVDGLRDLLEPSMRDCGWDVDARLATSR